MNASPNSVTITVDGQRLSVPAHRSVAAALMGDGGHAGWRRTRRGDEPRGLFCGIGVCYDCVATVDGRTTVRTCLVTVQDGMRVETAMGADPSDGEETGHA
mgnify:CR=1 FL=1